MADTKEKKFLMLFKLSDKASPKLKELRKNFKIFMKSQNELADKCKSFGALMAVPLGGAFATVAATVANAPPNGTAIKAPKDLHLSASSF